MDTATPQLELTDRFSEYQEVVLDDGKVLRRYDNGAVRLENPSSGVIQEERIDGKLLVSLPTGKVFFQTYPGEPLLVYDTSSRHPPLLAFVRLVNLPGQATASHAYHFCDHEGAHLVELTTLRYYRVGGPKDEPTGQRPPRRPVSLKRWGLTSGPD